MWKLFLVLALFCFKALAQIEAPLTEISFEQNPSDMEWRHIVTPHFDIIFPEEVESDAHRVAHLLEKAYPFVTRSLEVEPPRIPLVLQNQSTQSNGFVTLAPRRSEWYMTPAMDPEVSNTEWLKTLSLHEFRHVVQFEKTKQGFNRYFYLILGEVGQALGLGLTLPPWYLEGDAVGTETALSKGGRGRLPIFDRDLRTILLSGKDWNYDKAHLGSYEDYVPNHYYYGYFYTTYLKNMYGDLYLSRLANHAAEYSYNPLTFYNTVDRDTGKSFEHFYRHVIRDLIHEWKKRADALTPTPYEVQTYKHRFGWTNYYYPQVSEEGEIIALKRGLSYIDRFVAVKGEKERTLFYPGPLMNEYPFKVRGGKLAFIEWELDPRWGYRDFSRLKIYDLKKEKFIVDKRKTKWRLAVLDHKGDRTLLVEWDENQQQYILALDKKGKEILRIPHAKEDVITSLDWVNENEVVMVTKDYDDLKSMVKLNLWTREETVLIPKNVNNLGFVAVEEGNIFYESPLSGIDNVWLFTKDGPRQITSALFGAYAPTLKNNKLIYNDYTVKGMNVVTKTLPWSEEQKSQDSFFPVYEKFAKSEKAEELYASYNQKEEYKSERYSQVKHALNLHSWLLLAPPLGPSVVAEGFSRDILNKFNLGFGGSYNLNERTLQGFTSATWMHNYPVFDIRAAYGARKEDIKQNNREVEDRWEEGTFEAGVSVPWRYIQGRFLHSFTARAFAKLIKVTDKDEFDPTEVTDGALYSPGAHLSYSVTSRMARRDINPSLGFMLTGHAEDGRDITGSGMRGSIRSLDSRLFLPGLWHHHSFYHQFAYEKQNSHYYEYASYIFYPRGTKYGFIREFTKYSGNYTMPLFYPDYNLGRYIYFKRIALNLFYDELNSSRSYRAASTGWESIFEFSVVRLMFPISVGVRGSYVLAGEEKDSNYELFLASLLGTF